MQQILQEIPHAFIAAIRVVLQMLMIASNAEQVAM
jgi:hypothetical protein